VAYNQREKFTHKKETKIKVKLMMVTSFTGFSKPARSLIEPAHLHGLTVTGHLDSGFKDTINPQDAILLGIDRVEHFLWGGQAHLALIFVRIIKKE